MLHLQFRTDLVLTYAEDMLSVEAGMARYRLGGVSPAGRQALAAMQRGPCDENHLIDQLLEAEGGATLPVFMYLLNQLKQRGALGHSLATGALAGLTVTPQAEPFAFEPGLLSETRSFRWAHLVYFRLEDGQWCLACPLGNAQVTGIDQPLFWQLASALRTWQSIGSLATAFPQLTTKEWQWAVALLQAATTLEWQETAGQSLAPAHTWEFHDLLFHTRSRLGKHHYPYGGTMPRKNQLAPPAAVVDWPATALVALPAPPPATELAGPGLWEMLERRSSIRTYNEASPLTLEQLGHFLYRTARLKDAWPTPDGEFIRKPYPAGGGLYELEVYPVVAQCAGLEAGLYHYDARQHQLRQLSPLTAEARRLVDLAWFTANRESRPQVLLVVTARFQRISWKYQSVAYALILKHVGVLYQTFYLAATALGLAPCALGGGDSSLFAQAAGLNELVETSVGEFLLGSLPQGKEAAADA